MTLAMDLLNTHMSVPTSSHATVLSMPTALSARLADSLARPRHCSAPPPLSHYVFIDLSEAALATCKQQLGLTCVRQSHTADMHERLFSQISRNYSSDE